MLTLKEHTKNLTLEEFIKQMYLVQQIDTIQSTRITHKCISDL